MERLSAVWQKRKKNYTESYVFMFTRLWSFPFTYLLFHSPVSPNCVTWFAFLLRTLGAVFVGLNGFGLSTNDSLLFIILGAAFTWFAWVFDCVDGELARLKNMTGSYGHWLDGSLDRIGDLLILIAVALNALNHTSHFNITLIGSYFAVMGTTLWRHLAEQKKKIFNIPDSPTPLKPIGFDTGMMYLIITLFLLFNQAFYLMWIFAVLMTTVWIKNFVVTVVKKR